MTKLNNYIIYFKLNGFYGSKVVELENEKTGRIEKGIFIPFDVNELKPNKKGNYIVQCFANEWLFARGYKNQTHSLRLKLSGRILNLFKKNGWDSPRMGYMTRSFAEYMPYVEKEEKVKLSDYE